jgi:hypothetical protein
VEKIIEVKVADDKPSKALINFQKKYQYPASQLVYNLRNEYKIGEIEILQAKKFLQNLFM